MYTVKNLSASNVNTPFCDFKPLEERQFQQDLKGSDDGVAYAFFKESPQFLVTGGDYQNPGSKGDKGDTGATGPSVEYFVSGLVAAVRNAARYANNSQGGTGQATEANASVMIQQPGALTGLIAKADTTVTGAAVVTVTIFKNGVATGLTVSIAAAQTTLLQTSAGPVAVVAGDLISFEVKETANVAPVANFQASVKFTAT